MDTPRASIIVTGWRSAPYLIDCLRSLEARIRSVPYEVIVSLNEPTPSLLGAIGRDVDGIELLTSSVNRGFGGACNRGCAAARGDLLVLLNDDAIVLDGWLESLVAAADQHEEAGAVGSRIRLENGDLQEEGAVIWADGATTLIGYGRAQDGPKDLGLRRVDYCSAALPPDQTSHLGFVGRDRSGILSRLLRRRGSLHEDPSGWPDHPL